MKSNVIRIGKFSRPGSTCDYDGGAGGSDTEFRWGNLIENIHYNNLESDAI
jgi:hypothetical protein